MAGLQSLKSRLHNLVILPFRSPGELRDADLRPPRGIVLHGPHGTGKTVLAQAVAHAAGVNLVCMNGPEIFSKWLGESEEAIRHLFQVARQVAPCIIFIDQLDAIAPRRSSSAETRTAERVVNQLLVELDSLDASRELEIVVLAATNRLDIIDPSVLRAGRMGTHLHVPLPDQPDRAEILSLFLAGAANDRPGAAAQWCRDLAAETAGFSGADLRALVDDARLRAFQRGARAGLVWNDLDAALVALRGSQLLAKESGTTD